MKSMSLITLVLTTWFGSFVFADSSNRGFRGPACDEILSAPEQTFGFSLGGGEEALGDCSNKAFGAGEAVDYEDAECYLRIEGFENKHRLSRKTSATLVQLAEAKLNGHLQGGNVSYAFRIVVEYSREVCHLAESY